MSNELAKIPSYLQKYVKPVEQSTDFGELDPADFGLDILKIVQAQSKEAMPGPGQLEQGTMFLSKTGTVIQPGTKFVPLLKTLRYIYWKGRPGDGELVFMTDDRDDPRIKAIDGLAFRKENGETKAPLVTTYMNFYCWITDSQLPDIPVLISFKRTGFPDGRKVLRDLRVATNA